MAQVSSAVPSEAPVDVAATKRPRGRPKKSRDGNEKEANAVDTKTYYETQLQTMRDNNQDLRLKLLKVESENKELSENYRTLNQMLLKLLSKNLSDIQVN